MSRRNKSHVKDERPGRLNRGLREAALLLCVACAVFLLIALMSYDPGDPGWSTSQVNTVTQNLGGLAGAWIADILFSLLGLTSYAIPWLALYTAIVLMRPGTVAQVPSGLGVLRAAAVTVAFASACGIADLHVQLGSGWVPQGTGGIVGRVTGTGLSQVLNETGSTLFMLALFVASLPLALMFSWISLMEKIGGWVLVAYGKGQALVQTYKEKRAARVVATPVQRPAPVVTPTKTSRPAEPKKKRKTIASSSAKSQQMSLPIGSNEEAIEVPPFEGNPLPPVELLDPPRVMAETYSDSELENLSRDVERHLKDFGVDAQVTAVAPGPVVTRFEIQPAPGVKVSQISNLSRDLARALSTIAVRVVEVIPGKSVIGLEIPNQKREIVALKTILESGTYDASKSPLTLALGKDIGGHPVTADLGRMPHLLIAGTTGSGKSVAINVMLLSLLYKATAEQVRLIMIDPKMLELSVYDGIPHLLAPVVTDVKESAHALRWCVAEMERRYKLLAAVGVRNLAGFNRKVTEAIDRGEPIRDPLVKGAGEDGGPLDPVYLESLPHIVVVVDELADLMMVVGKKVEELIARLAQKARAAGIHLILATQRPSVDVITGLIKANIPARISFQVSSKIDSRTILDQAGAESLLGHGDMLYLPAGTGLPTRVHGAFVDDHEVHKVVAYLKQVGTPEYIDEIIDGGASDIGSMGLDEDTESDPLYDDAVRIVTESRKASISWVQRRLKVGYNRAARIVEQMEASGVIGAVQNNGTREVLAPPPPE